MRLSLATLLVFAAASAQAHSDVANVDAAVDVPTVLAGVTLALCAGLYLTAVRLGAPLSARHRAAFASGCAAIALALLSPLDGAADNSFAAHMVQHQLLMVLAPPLLILGRPFAALAATLPPPALRVAAWPLRLSPQWAWALHAAALWMWHLPRWFDAALASDLTHALQHASFFFSALLFWWAVFRRVRTGMAVLYVLTTLIHSGVLAALLTFAPSPLYQGTTLADQQLAGLIMWVPAGYAMLLAGLLAFHRFMEAHP